MTCLKRTARVAQTFHFTALRQARGLRDYRTPQVPGHTSGGDLKQLGDPAGVFFRLGSLG
jgi:hypothetical protein